jgi:hypothetical protein
MPSLRDEHVYNKPESSKSTAGGSRPGSNAVPTPSGACRRARAVAGDGWLITVSKPPADETRACGSATFGTYSGLRRSPSNHRQSEKVGISSHF